MSMLDLMTNTKYIDYQDFINGYSHPEFTSEKTHVHHIIPKCVGGSSEPDNLITLTISAHYEAHKLLAELATSEYAIKLGYALRGFTNTYNKPIYVNKTFSMTKRFNMKISHKTYDKDLIDILADLPRTSAKFFAQLKDITHYKTNIAFSSTKGFPPDEASKRYKLLIPLKKVNLARILKKQFYSIKLEEQGVNTPVGTYIINPNFIRPPKEFYELVHRNWEETK